MSHPHADLSERVAALRVWCEERIHVCRRVESSLGVCSAVAYGATTERETLSRVLERLGYPVPPRKEREGSR